MSETIDSRRWGGLVGGLILIAVGIAFLLGELQLVDFGRVWSWWPLILIALGVTKAVGADRWRDRRGGLILLLVGGWALINQLGLYGLDWGTSWPILLIGLGLMWVYEAMTRRQSGELPLAGERTPEVRDAR